MDRNRETAGQKVSRRVKEFCQKENLPLNRVLVGLSGGADSVCLLHLFVTHQKELGITSLAAAHFNHQLRGEEARRDALFCEELCQRWKVPFFLGEGDVPAYQQKRSCGLEEAARELRSAFFAEILSQQGEGWSLALAHTADDQLETVLMHLLRGSALKGAGGIQPHSVLHGVHRVRPILLLSRAEVEEYLKEHQLPFVEDSSNAENFCLRNRLRHQVIPLLKEENPQVVSRLFSTSLSLQQDEDCLSKLAKEAYEEALVCQTKAGVELDGSKLQSLHLAIRSRIWTQFLSALGTEVSKESVEQVESVFLKEQTAFAPTRMVKISWMGDRLVGETLAADPLKLKRPLPLAGETFEWVGRRLSLENFSWKDHPEKSAEEKQMAQNSLREASKQGKLLCFDREKVVGRVWICSLGELSSQEQTFSPIGMEGHLSLKTLCSSMRLSPDQKSKLLFVTDEQGLIGVFGVGWSRLSQRVAVDIQTEHIILIAEKSC